MYKGSKDFEEKVIKDYISKMPTKDVASKHGISDVSIYNILKRNGVTKRHYGRIDKEKNLVSSCYIKFEDLLENDWVIDDSPKYLKIPILEKYH